MNIGIIGHGFVGKAISTNLIKRGLSVTIYDKFIEEYNNFSAVLNTDLCFVSVPTPAAVTGFNLTAIDDVLKKLSLSNYQGIVVLKSTVLPKTTEQFQETYSNLRIIHNPEFLTARTAVRDFDEQQHIILGGKSQDTAPVLEFYQKYFPTAEISLCTSTESESVKLFCNCYYASKVQLFTEFKLISDQNDSNFQVIRQLMLKNGWINQMHTTVPGPDGMLSFGGYCFPKDLTALTNASNSEYTTVLSAVLKERNLMRKND